ncbi:hypothetical protein RUM44_002532 [Polyplax serrata]|uniref:Dolichyl-diphosphooligosaccharide--protein glycosyltransferase subunit 2 n=1 Tax=Polyplax serrata TaxID=468196 RepID=A0ABR1AF20_POLSC
MKAVLLLIIGSCLALTNSLSTNSYFTPANRNHAKAVLLQALEAKDVAAAHFGVLGLKLLGTQIPKTNELCKVFLDAANTPNPSTEVLFLVSTSYAALKTCPQALPVMNIVKQLNAVISDNSNIQELYYAVNGLVALNQKPQDVGKLIKIMQAILKKNDSLANLGYLFHIAASLGSDGAFAFDRIEDAVVQADEVDSKYLQYEGGLSITALLVRGAYKLATVLNKPVPLTNDQSVKFANYFLSRKSVQTPKGVWSLLEALNALTTNKYHLPVAVTLASSASVSKENPKITIKICDVLGNPIKPFTVIADSATRVSDNVVVLSKKKFDETSDNTMFTFNIMDVKPEKGMYKLQISASLKSPDPRVISNIGATMAVKVMCTAAIDFIDIGTADADQTTLPKMERVQYPNKLSKIIEVDAQQKILMRFNIKDKETNKLISAHQVFVRFYNTAKDKSFIFVAEPDSGLQYKFDLDIGAKSDDFDQLSGLYDVELIIGDAVLSNSFTWKLSSAKLTFAGEPKELETQNPYKPRPEIKHIFREPERRPAKFVSNLFSALVCAPILLLFVLWARLRINVSNFPFTLSALGFHLGLGAIFGLFGYFWLQLNMFQTVKYLLGIGLITFLCGNKLLCKLAQSKKSAVSK